eukprot:gene10703-8901_t
MQGKRALDVEKEKEARAKELAENPPPRTEAEVVDM